MDGITLESLGFTKEELQERVVDQICASILSGKSFDEDGNVEYQDSQFKKKLEERLKAHLNERINAIAEQHVLPNVSQYVESLTLQTTNKWGEKQGAPVTFVEYMVQRAEAHISEQVDYNGKGKTEADSYNWSGKTTRIAYLVNAHLHYAIETAMKQALATANSAIVGGIEAAVKMKLQEVVNGMKVAVTTK
jgi:hypothetical protein